MEFLSPEFCRIYGSELCLFERGVAYRSHFIVPVVEQGKASFKCGVISPAGDLSTLFNYKQEPYPDCIYSSIEEVITAGKKYVDACLSYWQASLLLDKLADAGILDADTNCKLWEILEQWHDEQMGFARNLNWVEPIEQLQKSA